MQILCLPDPQLHRHEVGMDIEGHWESLGVYSGDGYLQIGCDKKCFEHYDRRTLMYQKDEDFATVSRLNSIHHWSLMMHLYSWDQEDLGILVLYHCDKQDCHKTY